MKDKILLLLIVGIVGLGLSVSGLAYTYYVDLDYDMIETKLNLTELGLDTRIMNAFPFITLIKEDDGFFRIYFRNTDNNRDQIQSLLDYIEDIETGNRIERIKKTNDEPLCLKADNGVIVGCYVHYDRGYQMVCEVNEICGKYLK